MTRLLCLSLRSPPPPFLFFFSAKDNPLLFFLPLSRVPGVGWGVPQAVVPGGNFDCK